MNRSESGQSGSVFILSDLHCGDADCKLMDPDRIVPEEQVEIINGTAFRNDSFACPGDVGDPKCVPVIRARKKSCVQEP